MIRKPVVSGKFYADDRADLRSQIENCFLHPAGPGRLPEGVVESVDRLGLIVPHAGYMASGPVAAWGYYEAARRIDSSTVILIGPNHTGLGGDVSIWLEDPWETPFGRVEIDSELGDRLRDSSGRLIEEDKSAHLYEHSIEVQLPFVQYVFPGSKIVPLVMTDQRLETALALGEIIGKCTLGSSRVLIVASSDLNHYESHTETMEKDIELTEYLVSGDYKEAYRISKERKITACGLGPMVCVRSIFKDMEILKNTTSGEIIGDRYRTVGYLAAFMK